jgi:hypothetical protein
VYQPAVRGSCDGRTAGMFGEATMAKPGDGVGTCNTHFLRMIKFCQSNSALGCILKINSIG